MLKKSVSVDLIEVLENGSIQVRTKTAIMEDGKQIGSTFHRHVVAPGDDYSGECDKVKAICAATHTAEVVAAYQAALAEQQNPAA
jgi:hypothetical protein